MRKYLKWYIAFPLLAWILFFVEIPELQSLIYSLETILLLICVVAAVHHSEVIAQRVGEPFGTIVLAVAITIIEVALIISLMIAGGEKALYLARDTVFAAVMIILNAIIGVCLLVGSIKYREQFFEIKSVNTALVCLISIVVFTLVLPNYTTSLNEAKYTTPQLFFAAFACLIIYATFLMIQTVRHRNYFEPVKIEGASSPSNEDNNTGNVFISILFLLVCLTIVVLLAKSLSPLIEETIAANGLPQALVGIIIALVVLLPEGLAAVKAAIRNDIQTSLNLSFGSALAAIGLTIPSVSIVSYIYDIDMILGLERKSLVLLALSLFIVLISLNRGKTNVLYGVVLIINFLAFIITTIFP